MVRARKASWAAVAVVGLGLSLVACSEAEPGRGPASTTSIPVSSSFVASPEPPSPESEAPVPAEVEVAEPLTKLDSLAVKGRAPKTGYDRDLFGQAWSDDVAVAGGRNGCDTRNDILRRDLVAIEIRPGSNGCAVLGGTLHDPYSGTTVLFRRGPDTSAEVQIDHIVALSDAWQKGAQQWDEVKRRNFANDPLNLQATVGAVNQQKGDGDAATWLPPNRSYRCTYVTRIVEVKTTYGLWVTQAERDAIARVLSNCAPDAPPPVAPASVPPEPDSVYYPNCKAARAAGAAPLYAGQPGYRIGMDGDGDGVACER